jgi:hypothetical protein
VRSRGIGSRIGSIVTFRFGSPMFMRKTIAEQCKASIARMG